MLEPFRDFLEQTVIPLRLACITRQGWPLVTSLWFVYEQGRLYCATQESAKVIYHLRQNPRCGFEIAGDQPPYRGVRGQAEAILSPELGPAMLERLIRRYLKGLDSPLGKRLLSQAATEVAIEIKPLRIFQWDYTDRMKNSLPKVP